MRTRPRAPSSTRTSPASAASWRSARGRSPTSPRTPRCGPATSRSWWSRRPPRSTRSPTTWRSCSGTASSGPCPRAGRTSSSPTSTSSASTPHVMHLAGFGELCSMFTAPADWYLAHATGMDDAFDPTVVALFRDGADDVLAAALRGCARSTTIPSCSPSWPAGWRLTGIAMGVAGRTAPLSGTEHLAEPPPRHGRSRRRGARPRSTARRSVSPACWPRRSGTTRSSGSTRASSRPETRRADAGRSRGAGSRGVRPDRSERSHGGRVLAGCPRGRSIAGPRSGRTIAAFVDDWERHKAALRTLVATPERLANGPDRGGCAGDGRRPRPAGHRGGRPMGAGGAAADARSVHGRRPALPRRRLGRGDHRPPARSIRASWRAPDDRAAARPDVRRLRLRPRRDAVPRRRAAPGRRRRRSPRSATTARASRS